MKEFFKSLFLPALCALPGLATYPLFSNYSNAHDLTDMGGYAFFLAALLALICAVVIAARFWRRSRPRAWGAIAGLFAAPLMIGAAGWLFLVLSGAQVMAR